ncbi:MAG: hypothetical protein IBX41_03340 [Methanophagales archaeon]|nr:hypothetical protein [Methanophagales archaeon]
MSSEITNLINSYMQQAESLLAQIHQLQARFKSPGTEVVKDLLGEVGGAWGEALLESTMGRRWGKKLTKGLLTQQQEQQLALEEQRIEYAFSGLVSNLSSFFSSISIKKPGLKPEGNSYILSGKLAKTQEHVRLETRIKKLIATLQAIRTEPLIYNRDIPQLLEQERAKKVMEGKPYETLKELETKLRGFISSKLESITPNWWKERIPDDVRKRAEERKAKNEKLWPWHTQKDLHPIHYIDFTDYVKIITRKDNWEGIFVAVFKEKEIISVKLKELESIRNAIAHSRELDNEETEKFRIYAREILKTVR